VKTTTINLLACPVCQKTLTLQTDASVIIKTGNLHCSRCQQDYPIEQGIPHFIKPEILFGFNPRFARLYNGFSWGYRLFFRITFAYIGMDEEAVRRDDPERGPCLVKGW
jgi:uncharacterized protein YbaR (Trm112 family)